MRARLLLCLPIAAVLTFVILGLGASFGSAVATRLIVSPAEPTIQLARFAASPAPGSDPAGTTWHGPGCAQAKGRLASLVRSAIRCDDDPRCLASPLFCPIELDGCGYSAVPSGTPDLGLSPRTYQF